jgi:hypothetical protein
LSLEAAVVSTDGVMIVMMMMIKVTTEMVIMIFSQGQK